MNELLFECYQIPAVSLGVDALFSLQKNFSEPFKPLPSAMIVRLGYQTSHIIPIIGMTVKMKMFHVYLITLFLKPQRW